jgi:hypothetical protein
MDDGEAQARGARAADLLNNDLLKEAFQTLEEAYIKTWRETDATNQIGREKLFIAVNVVGKVREHLETVVSSGKVAAAQLKLLAQETERKKRFGVI